MIPVIDIFAGPGGLNEGFSSVLDANGNPVFRTTASIEMESNAIETLTLRAALRSLRQGHTLPSAYYDFLNGKISQKAMRAVPGIAAALDRAARDEVFQIELGETTREHSDAVIGARIPQDGPWALIGGPPCQAYSLVGRARRRGDEHFYEDKKHFLFKEYLHILDRFRPSVFVMENVKGLLSSRYSGQSMFEMIHRDLSLDGAYEIRSLVVDSPDPAPSDFVIRSERFGVAQRRHRVILLGVLSGSGITVPVLDATVDGPTVDEAIGDLPSIRSMVSPRSMDAVDRWAAARNTGRGFVGLGALHTAPPGIGGSHVPYRAPENPTPLQQWLTDPNLKALTLHEPRSHMEKDLVRYEYLAWKMKRDKERPTVKDLPADLLPNHHNVKGDKTPFTDRFKVQAADGPSSTVASHISKDGHYYIHPDPDQMRSLTVREAARLQSFPDNYFFCGNRTAQYHQVGNAVPPYLARQIGIQVAKGLGEL